jgi:hypothetical protein
MKNLLLTTICLLMANLAAQAQAIHHGRKRLGH